MDTMPDWFWIPTAIILWSIVLGNFTAAILRAPVDPNPELSRLDLLDRGEVAP
jgi:hypothetical protein